MKSSNVFSDHNEIRNQEQEKFWNIHKHTENKQHAFEQPMSQRRNLNEILKYPETKKNGTIMYQNVWDTAKAVLWRKFAKLNVYLKKKEGSQIKQLMLYPEELEKGKQTKPKVSRRKEMKMVRAEINGIETRNNNRKDQ